MSTDDAMSQLARMDPYKRVSIDEVCVTDMYERTFRAITDPTTRLLTTPSISSLGDRHGRQHIRSGPRLLAMVAAALIVAAACVGVVEANRGPSGNVSQRLNLTVSQGNRLTKTEHLSDGSVLTPPPQSVVVSVTSAEAWRAIAVVRALPSAYALSPSYSPTILLAQFTMGTRGRESTSTVWVVQFPRATPADAAGTMREVLSNGTAIPSRSIRANYRLDSIVDAKTARVLLSGASEVAQ